MKSDRINVSQSRLNKTFQSKHRPEGEGQPE
jgi:hypothetical protein